MFRDRGTDSLSIIMVVLVMLATLVPPAGAVEGCAGANHKGPDYAGQDLTDHNFSNQQLAGANFSGAKLNGAVFDGANLTGADFSLASLGQSTESGRTASFTSATLDQACFKGAELGAVNLQFSSLTCTVFDGTNLSSARFGPVIKAASPDGSCRTSFRNATMSCEFIPQWRDLAMESAQIQLCSGKLAGHDFSNAQMSRVIFSGLDLSDTTWRSADLKGAFFINATLDDAILSGANLRQAQLSQASAKRATIDLQADLSGAHLSGIDLSGANLDSAILQGADGLAAADLSVAFLRNASFSGAVLTGVNMSHSNFYGSEARADGASLQQVNWTYANLATVDLTGQGSMRGARLDGANLINAKLVGRDLSPASSSQTTSLIKANLQGTDFEGAQLYGANLANAAIGLGDGVPLFAVDSSAILVNDLDARQLSAEVVEAFTGHGQPLPACENPRVIVLSEGRSWQINTRRPVGDARYNNFDLAYASGTIEVTGYPGAEKLFSVSDTFAKTLDRELTASELLATFAENGVALPPCTNPQITVTSAGTSWKIDRETTSASQVGLGYSAFRLSVEDSEIQVAGNRILVVQEDGQGQLSVAEFDVHETVIGPENLDDDTVCPNQKSYKANVEAGIPWKAMMTAPNPPAPPDCIPSPTRWCD